MFANEQSLSWSDDLLFMSKIINYSKKSNHQIKYSILLEFTTAKCKHFNHSKIFSQTSLFKRERAECMEVETKNENEDRDKKYTCVEEKERGKKKRKNIGMKKSYRVKGKIK